MTQVDKSIDFKITVPLEKSEREDGGWYVKGVAAGANVVDKQGDMLLPEAISKLAAQINSNPVPLRNQHQVDSITEDIGEVVKAQMTPDFELYIEARLDQDNPVAQYLWKKLDQRKQYGMSIRGDTHSPIIEKSSTGYISKHHTVNLAEVSVTTRPYYTHSLGTVLRKAIDDADYVSFASSGDNTEMADSTTGVTGQESSAPENDTTTLTPSDEIVKSLMANDDFRAFMAETIKSALPAQPATSTEDTTEISKSTEEESSDSTSTDIAEIVKSAVEEVSKGFTAQLEALANKIPDVQEPPVLVKSETENVREAISGLSSFDRLRAGLAAQHNELDKLR